MPHPCPARRQAPRTGVMRRKHGLALLLAAAALLPATPAAARSLAIGSFTVGRGGDDSLVNKDTAKLRKAIRSVLPGSTFNATKTLTKAFLAKVHVLVVGAAYAPHQGITPLSAAEQKAVVNFVKAGGSALLFCDNDTQFGTASNSFASPFGLATTGTLADAQTATYLNVGNNPLQSGPFGTAAQFDTSWPGWFSTLGSATPLAQLAANGQAEIAYLPAGSLGAGSGTVVFFADTTALLDSLRTRDDQIAILNALGLAP